MPTMTPAEEQTVANTTAAKRLLKLLGAIRNTDENFITLIPRILDTNDSVASTMDVNRAWNAIRSQKLIAQMLEDFIRELEDARLPAEQQAMSMRCLDGVVEALSPTTMSTARQFSITKIRDIDMVQLEFVDVLLRERVAEKEIPLADREQLEQTVEEALETLKGVDIPDKLKDFIQSQLQAIKNALNEYKFRGMRGVEVALAGYMGSYDAGRLEEAESLSPENKLTLRKVFEDGQKLVNIARGLAWLYPHLLNAVHEASKLLGH